MNTLPRAQQKALLLLLFCALLWFALPGCKKATNLADKSPTGMVIYTAPEARTAPVMAKLIYGLVPPQFQPRGAMVSLRELDTKAIAELRARDLLSPLPVPPYGIDGYTQFPDNNPDNRLNTFTNIYFVPNRAQQEMAQTVLHEWGHFVLTVVITPAEQEEWASLALRVPDAQGYKGKGNGEQFAQYFAIWCARRKDKDFPLPIPPDVVNYFDALLARRV